VYKELGHEFLYWADTYADDLPYWKQMPGNPDEGLVMMPYTLDCVSGPGPVPAACACRQTMTESSRAERLQVLAGPIRL
jgi:hypothetical protein